MGMMNKEEKLLIKFINEHKGEIPDDGFSDKVMQILPSRSCWHLRIMQLVFFLLAISLFVLLDGKNTILYIIKSAAWNGVVMLLTLDISLTNILTLVVAVITITGIIFSNMLASKSLFH